MSAPMSFYEQVGEFHEMFGHPVSTEPQLNVFFEKPELVPFRTKLIREEVEELMDAIHKKDYIECVDAICDTLYFLMGTYQVLGVNFDKLEKEPYVFTGFTSDTYLSEDYFNDRSKFFDSVLLQNTMSNLIAEVEEIEILVRDIKESGDYSNSESYFNKLLSNLETIDFICHALALLFSADIEKCFAEVHRSNMTKLCKSEEEAQLTVDKYNSDPENRYDPGYRKHGDFWVVFNKTDSKIIKSINFELPNLARVLNYVL